jgi:hypothetical protein
MGFSNALPSFDFSTNFCYGDDVMFDLQPLQNLNMPLPLPCIQGHFSPLWSVVQLLRVHQTSKITR